MSLILTRRVGEVLEFTMGDILVKVKVTSIKGNQISLAMDAPQSVNILREEVAIRNESRGNHR